MHYVISVETRHTDSRGYPVTVQVALPKGTGLEQALAIAEQAFDLNKAITVGLMLFPSKGRMRLIDVYSGTWDSRAAYEDDYDTAPAGSLECRYAVYRKCATDLGWDVKTFDQWCNS